MPRIARHVLITPSLIAFLLFACIASPAQGPRVRPRSRVVAAVDERQMTVLRGNVHPLARPESDLGAVTDATPMNRILLVLQRSEEQETALRRLLDEQQDKGSSSYHRWMTPESFGSAFGPSDGDVAAVEQWLAGRGFSGIKTNRARTVVEFSGTAGAVSHAFHTTMHRYMAGGVARYANSVDPAIPAALAPVIAGVASLNNFPRVPASRKVGEFQRDNKTGELLKMDGPAAVTVTADATGGAAARLEVAAGSVAKPDFTFTSRGNTFYGVTPYDFATIYNVLPLWNASSPVDGTGQTIAIVGQTDINPVDFVNFRKLFGLPLGNTATPTGTQYLNIIYNGPNPGVNGDEGEADIDTQWSSAVAKGATIDFVTSEGTEVTQGTDLSALYIVDNNLAPVMSYSYGGCELFNGTSGNAFFNSIWQQAAAQGITVMVSTGDSGSAVCDNAGSKTARAGLAVNALASTPYNVAVGGTDFYMPTGGAPYWNATNDPATGASVKGYIPETTWNDSCTNGVLALTRTFSGETPEQVCNNPTAATDGLLTVGGASGGASSCIRSNGNSIASCAGGYAKPSWQTGAGVPADGVRDLPDVSLFASNGFFGAFYIVCQQSLSANATCSLAAPYTHFAGYGGTSVAAPAFAGVMALVNQKTGARQGNANYVLYNLAGQQSRAGTACDASGGPSAACTFNDITNGTIAMPCTKGTPNCVVNTAGDSYGILSGWTATPGYDLATGLGSVNAANLVNNWSNAVFTSTSTSLTLTPQTIAHGSPVTATVTVSSANGTPSGDVSVNGAALNGSLGDGQLAAGSFSQALQTFPGGTYAVRAHYGGNGTYAASDSNPVTLTVTPENSTTTLRALMYNVNTGGVSVAASAPYGSLFLLRVDVAGLSGQGLATGNVKLTDNGAALDAGNFGLNSEGNTEDQTADLLPANHLFAASFGGDPSFNASAATGVALTINKAATVTALTANVPSVTATTSVTLKAQITTRSFGHFAPSGAVTFLDGATVLGTGTLTGTVDPATFFDVSTASITIAGSALQSGTNQITATFGGDNNYLGSGSTAVTVTLGGVSTGSFALTPNSAAATVTRGGSSSSVTLSVAPSGGFNSAVSFSCTNGLPAGAACSFNPATVTISGTSAATTSLSFTATAPSDRSGTGAKNEPPSLIWRLGGGTALCAVLLLGVRRRRLGWNALAVLIAGVCLAALSGCGSGFAKLAGNPGTATGTYAITVTAAGGGITQTNTVTLTVQ